MDDIDHIDFEFEGMLTELLSVAPAPDGFGERVMAEVRAITPPVKQRNTFAEWQRVGASLVACGALLMVLNMLPVPPAQADRPGSVNVGRRIENAFYDFADFISSPMAHLSELLKGGIGNAP